MAQTTRLTPRFRRLRPQASWFEKAMALLACIDLLLVLFDYSYLPLRNFYFREAPTLVKLYDPVKAIEPHRDTQRYLDTVDQLQQDLIQGGLQDPQVDSLLLELQAQSVAMIEEDPFAIANKSGTLEKIKNRMRRHLQNDSAKQAFRTFWSQNYLEANNWTQQLQFFNQEIRPLMETNYFRPIGESGEPLNYFILIDLVFISIFGLEFLARSYMISRRHPRTSWLDGMLWRWYDLLLLIPFWRWLRVIPVALRLQQVGWFDYTRIQAQVNRNLAENLAGELTEMVVVRTIGLAQGSLEQGAIAKWLAQPSQTVEINDINEIAVILERLIKITLYQVYPKIQPDIDALISHSMENVLNQLPLYKSLQYMPGVQTLPADIARPVAHQLSQGIYEALTQALEDPSGGEIFNQLSQHFVDALQSELQDKQTIQDVQILLIDFLEELKLTFVRRAETEAVDHSISDLEALRQTTYARASMPNSQAAADHRLKLQPSAKDDGNF